MSFPGYLKSLQLKNRRHTEPGTISDERPGDRASNEEDHEAARKDRHNSSPTPPKAAQSPRIRLDIVDERGNLPSKSLWVGNIPPRTSGVELRALFGKYGPIISTKPAAKYAFVNFETIESALDAFRECHDRDIFNTGNSTINIRFTTTLAEARQGKDEGRLRGNSMTKKIEAVRSQWFGSGKDLSNKPQVDPLAISEWPNGQPPSGPKSHRRDISPPPLRRGDSYRPLSFVQQEDQHPETNRGRSYEGKSGRGADVYRPSEHGFTSQRSESWSRSSSFSRSVSTTPSRGARRKSSRSPDQWPDSGSSQSPLPWERARKHREVDDERWAQGHQALSKLASVSSAPLKAATTNLTLERPASDLIYVADFQDADDDIDDNYSPKLLLQTPDSIGQEQSDSQHDAQPANHMPEGLSQAELLTLGPLLELRQHTKSPLMRAMERVFGTRDGARGGSVASEVATSSSRTSVRKKRCSDCKKAASDLSPLTHCSTCTRGFHSGCGDPNPSRCPDMPRFVCGRCLQKSNPGAVAATAVSAPLTSVGSHPNAKLDGKAHLISPPLTHNQDGNGSTQLSPCEDLPRAVSNQTRIESLFDVRDSVGTFRTDVVSSTRYQQQQPITTRRDSEKGPKLSPQSPMRSSDQTTVLSQGLADSQQNALKYKIVTCKWWAAGICTQSEEGCYYAHSPTNISFPTGKKANRYWTCHEWLHGSCEKHDESCLYAHKDTGLHVGRDGSPSFKHVTCYWWIRSSCRFTEKLCKFAHKDTGLYGLDPSEKWHGGPKFSTVHPALAGDQRTRQFPFTTQPTADSDSRSLDVLGNVAVKQANWHSCNLPAQTSTIDSKTTRVDSVTLSRQSLQSSDLSSSDNATDLSGDIPGTKDNEQPQNTPVTSSDLNGERSMSFNAPGTEDQNGPKLLTYANAEILENAMNHTFMASVSAALQQDICEEKMDQRDNKRSRLDVQTDQSLRDPRLTHRKSAIPLKASTLQIGSDPHISPVVGTGEQVALQSTSTDRTSNGVLTSRKILQRCKKCQKPVFGAQVCRTCLSDGPEHKSPILADQSLIPNSLPSGSVEIPSEGVNVADALVKDLGHEVREPSARPAFKNPLKRSASNNNSMFLKNKRPKCSMLFSSGGKLQLNTVRHLVNGQARQTNDTLIRKTQHPRQSLDDLIREERAKNEAKPSEPAKIATTENLLANVNSKENEIPDSDEIMSSRASSPLPTIEDIQNNTHNSCKVENGYMNHNVSSASPQSISKLHQSPGAPHDTDQGLSCSSESDSQPLATRTQRKRYVRTDSEDSKPDKVSIKISGRETFISNAGISEDGFQDSLTRDEVGSRRVGQPQRNPKPIAHANDIIWASSITCMACRKNHKKCLHDKNGSLSAYKCHEYILSRNGRRDTGRSNQEWQAVLDAAQVDTNVCENEALLPDGRYDIASQTSSTESSEETSAVGDTNDSGTELASGDEVGKTNDNKMKKVPTVIVNVPVSRESSHKAVMARVKKQVHEFVWTTEDEMQATMRLKSKGVMFESDSEDDDYLSDDHQAPQLPKRPVDPLHVPSRWSRDLFEVAPELSPQRMEDEQLAKIQSTKPRPSRKEQWATLRRQQLQERRERFGDPHREVSRVHAEIMVTALIERVVSPANSEQDRFAVGSVQTKEEEISFASFLGVPKSPRACLMSDKKRLAFKDGRDEVDRAWVRTSRGLSKRTTDDEKFPVRTK